MPSQSVPGVSFDETVGVAFRVTDHSYPFVGASDATGSVVDLREMVPRGGGAYSEFFHVGTGDAERVLDIAAETPHVEPALLHEDDDSGLYEFVVEDGCVAVSMAEQGGRPRTVRGESGEGILVAEVPVDRADRIVRDFLDEHDGVEYLGERDIEVPHPMVTRSELLEVVHDVLSRRQREVLVTAFSLGFYDWSRATDVEELADRLAMEADRLRDVLRASERELVSALLDDDDQMSADQRGHPLTDSAL